MKIEHRQSGMSLLEEVLVVAIVAAVIFFALPSVRQLFNTLETPGGTKSLISSALASARALAAQKQQYVGIRFQHACYIDEQGNIQPNQSPLKMPQYMIFIEQPALGETESNDQDTFNVIEGIEPIKLPENIGVMDRVINGNNDIDSDDELLDTTTFSIIFSPSGKLIVNDVLTRNQDGEESQDISEDDIFNTWGQVQNRVAMFIQDKSPLSDSYLIEEPSRRAFIIYDRNILRSLPYDERYDKYLKRLKENEMIYINPHTGTFINK